MIPKNEPASSEPTIKILEILKVEPVEEHTPKHGERRQLPEFLLDPDDDDLDYDSEPPLHRQRLDNRIKYVPLRSVVAMLCVMFVMICACYALTHDPGCPSIGHVAKYDYYPGRANGSTADSVFCFGAYLHHIGARTVLYQFGSQNGDPDGALGFFMGDRSYHLCTNYDHEHGALVSSMSVVLPDGTTFVTMPRIAGASGIVMDHDRPLWVERGTFAAWHYVTAQHEQISGCPFCGFGIYHYEITTDGNRIPHVETPSSSDGDHDGNIPTIASGDMQLL